MYSKTTAFIQELIETNVIPGASVGFIKQQEQTTYYLGQQQLIPDMQPTTEKTCYDMASLTKVMLTTTLILKLVETGDLFIDQPLKVYLPEWHEGTVTLRHLLTHTSDINGFILNRDSLSKDELKEAILSLPVGEQVGLKKVYTDTGTLLMGWLLEEYYQMDLHTLFTQEVLLPLGMTASCFDPSHSEHVAPTEQTLHRGLIKGHVHDPKAFVLQEHCGSAGLFSTLGDSLLFVQMMLSQGQTSSGRQFLAPETILNLLNDQTPTRTLQRSLGWDLLRFKESESYLLYHTGYTGTFMILDIIQEEAFVFLSNRVHPIDKKTEYLLARDKLVEIYLKEKTKT